MKRSALLAFAVAAVVLVVPARHSSALAAVHSSRAPQAQADPVSGDWNLSFFAGGMEVPGTLTMKLEGTTVTGTVETEHTGKGTLVNGTFADGKLTARMDFASHESIEITATIKEGKLTGRYTTEGRTDQWSGVKK